MKSWCETLRFSRPLVSARMAPPGSSAAIDEAHERERAAYDRGRTDGERSLGEQLVRQRSELQELQRGIFSALRQSITQVTTECETACIQLAVAAARKVVAGAPIDAPAVEAAVREALAGVERSSSITVLLNAEDLALLQRHNANVLLTDKDGDRLRFEASPEVSRGGCLVRTAFGAIDARRETKFQMLEKSLFN
jgi:flagellar assembly protein FliH